MSGDPGYWPPGDHRRADHGDYLDEDDFDQAPGYHGRDDYRGSGGYGQPGDQQSDGYPRPGELGPQPGYGEPDYYRGGTYGDPAGYGDRQGYGDPAGDGDQPAYGDPAGYRHQPGYGDPAGYGGAPDHADPAGYGAGGYGSAGGYGDQAAIGGPPGYGGQPGYGRQDGYGEPSGHGDRAGYGEPGGFGDQPGYGDDRDYGARPAGRGRHSAGSAPGAPGHDSTDPYGDAAYGTEPGGGRYGTGSYGPEAGYRPADPYDPLGGHGTSGALRRDEPGTGEFSSAPGYQWSGQYPEPGSPPGRYEPGGYGDTGSFAGAGADYLGSDPLGPTDTGSFDPAGGSPGRADAGSHSGWAFRPEAASYGSGALGDPGTGSFPRADSESFARPDTGSFDQDYSTGLRQLKSVPAAGDDEYEHSASPDSDVHDSGSIRWTAGPPPLKTRADRNREDAGLAGPSSAGPDGYAEWHHDPADDDWPDDEGGGLLSRRFGRGGDAAPADSGKGGGRSRNRGRKRRRFRGKAAFTIAILAVVLVLGAGTFVGYKYINRVINDRYGDYHGPGYGTVQVTVPEGANLVGLGPMLVRQGVIKAVRPFDSAAAAAKGTLQPGLYKLHHHMNAAMAVTLLLGSAARIPDQVTIIEGTRASEIAKQFADRTGFSSSSFMQIIDHPPASLGLPSWAGPTAEGFLFPDTYTLTPHETQLQILQAMVREFNQHVASINIASEAAKVFTTPWHVLIVASMVQAEGGRLQDFGGIARVAWNRLRVKMPLQFDSTVFYAMGSHGTAITQQDEKYDSPYNTYLHKGLPPGPIGNPGIDAIKAALHPASGGWLYFITDTRPKHPPYPTYFTKSLKQLQIWQRKFQN